MKNIALLSAIALILSATAPLHSSLAANSGDLIKCPDFSSVYYLAEDGKRYVFPNEHMYFSWYSDFDDVRTVSCADLAALPLGDRIVYQAGTKLIKMPSDPSVFVVESDGLLREIPDEDTAEALFGDDWSERVDDVSEAFWSSFTVGEPLSEDEVPEGTILKDDSGNLFRVEDDGSATEIDSVLSAEQEDILEDHAIALNDIEERLGLAMALTRVDAEAAIEVLEALIAELKTIKVEHEDEVEIEDLDEIEDEDEQNDDAKDAISDAEEEIAKAESDIAEDKAEGKDVSASESLLADAREKLAQAEAALASSDFDNAETQADDARHDAMWARGKAVDSIDNDDESDDSLDDENDSDETDDKSIDDITDTEEDSTDAEDDDSDDNSSSDNADSSDDSSDDDSSDD